MNAYARTLAPGLALVLVGAIAASTAASAQDDRRYRGGYVGPVGAGILAGVAAGAIIGAVAPPFLGAPYAYAPGPGCYMTQAPAYDQWGRFAGYGPMQVCD